MGRRNDHEDGLTFAPQRDLAADFGTQHVVDNMARGVDRFVYCSTGELTEIAEATKQSCTISIAIRGAVAITYDITAVE